jgi:hypothetical protein
MVDNPVEFVHAAIHQEPIPHLLSLQSKRHINFPIVPSPISEPLQANNYNLVDLVRRHPLYAGLVLLALLTVHAVSTIKQLWLAEILKTVSQSHPPPLGRNGQVDVIELFEENVQLLARLALVDCLEPAKHQLV